MSEPTETPEEVEILRKRVKYLEEIEEAAKKRDDLMRKRVEEQESRINGLIADLSEARAEKRRSERYYGRLVDQARHEGAEAIREQAAAWHDEQVKLSEERARLLRQRPSMSGVDLGLAAQSRANDHKVCAERMRYIPIDSPKAPESRVTREELEDAGLHLSDVPIKIK